MCLYLKPQTSSLSIFIFKKGEYFERKRFSIKAKENFGIAISRVYRYETGC